MSSVQVIVGHTWAEDVRFLNSLRARRPAGSVICLSEIRDIIDIVVEGRNITASIPEESIFDLMDDVLAALIALLEGTSTKAIVEFQHEPWELVLLAAETKLHLSLYSIDRRQQVIARDLPVEAHSFVNAFCSAAEELLTELFRVSEHFSQNPQIRRISQSLARLRRTRKLRFSPLAEAPQMSFRTQSTSTSSAGGLTLEYELDSADLPLQRYNGEHIFDLHALLFHGEVRAEFGPHQLLLADAFPFLAISSLLDRARQLLNQLESLGGDSFHLTEPISYIDLEVYGEGAQWRLRARDLSSGLWREWSTSPTDCIDALVSLGEYFVQDLRAANPHLELNQRFLDLEQEVEKLRLWHRDRCGNNLYHDQPDDYLRHHGHLRPEPPPRAAEPGFSWPLSQVRTLFPRRRWSIRAERIDFSSLRLTGQGLILPTRNGVQCLDIQSGTHRWEHKFSDPVNFGNIIELAGPYVVLTGTDRAIEILDLATGSLKARVEPKAPWRGLSNAAYFAEEKLLVISSRAGEFIGVEPESGNIRWEYQAGSGQAHQVIFDGPLLCIQSSEGQVFALNPQTGAPLWKIRLGARPDEQGLRFHQGRLYSITHDPLHQSSVVHALYPFTGRAVWQTRLPGVICGAVSFIDRWMVVPVERRGQILLVGLDLEALDPRHLWQLPLSSAGVDRPTKATPVLLGNHWHGLIRTDRAELTCFRVHDGAIRWQVMPSQETLLLYGNLPLFTMRDVVINVAQTVDLRHLETGELLHSFEAIEAPEFGYLAAPFCLLLGERAPQDDDIDQLTAFGVDHFLALVPPA